MSSQAAVDIPSSEKVSPKKVGRLAGRTVAKSAPRSRKSPITSLLNRGFPQPKPRKYSRTFKKKKSLWNPRFPIAFSKDNALYHKGLREYFDQTSCLVTPGRSGHSKKPSLSRSFGLSRPRHSHQSVRSLRRKALLHRRLEGSWHEVFDPISELNLTKYNSQRRFFSSMSNEPTEAL